MRLAPLCLPLALALLPAAPALAASKKTLLAIPGLPDVPASELSIRFAQTVGGLRVGYRLALDRVSVEPHRSEAGARWLLRWGGAGGARSALVDDLWVEGAGRIWRAPRADTLSREPQWTEDLALPATPLSREEQIRAWRLGDPSAFTVFIRETIAAWTSSGSLVLDVARLNPFFVMAERMLVPSSPQSQDRLRFLRERRPLTELSDFRARGVGTAELEGPLGSHAVPFQPGEYMSPSHLVREYQTAMLPKLEGMIGIGSPAAGETDPAPVRVQALPDGPAGERIAALATGGRELLFSGPVVGGGSLRPLSVNLADAADLHHHDGVWQVRLRTGESHAFARLSHENGSVPRDGRWQLTDEELAARSPAEIARQGRLRRLRAGVPTPSEGDVSGVPVGQPERTELSSVHVTDAVFDREQGWLVTVGDQVHRFTPESFQFGGLLTHAEALEDESRAGGAEGTHRRHTDPFQRWRRR